MNNVVLIGMPGSGKSTAGVLLAKALGYGFVDTDLVLQQRMGMLLHEYIAVHGIRRFLDFEGEALMALEANRCVVATGGSAVMRGDAMEHLRSQARAVVYLKLPLEEVARRIGDITTRGVAMEPGQTLGDVYQLRAPLYERFSTHVLDCAGQRVEDTVGTLVHTIRAK